MIELQTGVDGGINKSSDARAPHKAPKQHTNPSLGAIPRINGCALCFNNRNAVTNATKKVTPMHDIMRTEAAVLLYTSFK